MSNLAIVESRAPAHLPQEIRLSLPYPVSANRYWVPINIRPRGDSKTGKVRQIFVLSTEAKAYKEELAWRARAAGIRKPIVGRVEVDIYLYPARPKDFAKRMQKSPDNWDDDVRSIDLDNANKVLFDAMKGHVIDDDKWVWKITSQRMEPDGEARVEIVIRQIQRSSQQGSLI
jgi:crossover junction endodeoxyribonuclease RusA